jgi:hypothetical protein
MKIFQDENLLVINLSINFLLFDYSSLMIFLQLFEFLIMIRLQNRIGTCVWKMFIDIIENKF